MSCNGESVHTSGCLRHESLSVKQIRLGGRKRGEVVHGECGRNLGTSSKETHFTTKDFEVISSPLKKALLLGHLYVSWVQFHYSRNMCTGFNHIGSGDRGMLKISEQKVLFWNILFQCKTLNTHTHIK